MSQLIVIFSLIFSLSSLDNDNREYASTQSEAIEYVCSQIDNLEIVSYSEMDDGWYFEGYINYQRVQVFYMDSQDNKIDIYYTAR